MNTTVHNKDYIRKRPTMSFSLPSDITMLINSLSITVGINKSSVIERFFELVMERYTMDEIIDALQKKIG
jgi:hypothetical protein